ncbi:MAG: hypothetical protein H7836_17350 [Magnetococcus sp. YQC-3]
MISKIGFGEKWYKEYHRILQKQCDIMEVENDDNTPQCIKDFAERETIRKFSAYLEWAEKLNEVYEKLTGKSGENPYKGWYFLTIRPHQELNFLTFKQFIKTLFTKKCWEEGFYVWEQKGTSEKTLGNGFHIHAKIKVKSPSKGKKYFLGEIFNLIRKLSLDEYIANNCVDLKQISSETHWDNTEKYIDTNEFNKNDKQKEKAWSLDKRWRASKELKDIYYINELCKQSSKSLPTEAMNSPFFKSGEKGEFNVEFS